MGLSFTLATAQYRFYKNEGCLGGSFAIYYIFIGYTNKKDTNKLAKASYIRNFCFVVKVDVVALKAQLQTGDSITV